MNLKTFGKYLVDNKTLWKPNFKQVNLWPVARGEEVEDSLLKMPDGSCCSQSTHNQFYLEGSSF